jgi:hypothetical protein
MEITRSCAKEGSVQAAVYVSEESAIVSSDNFINADFGIAVCNNDEGHLVQERPGSGCFEANRTDCAFDCEVFFNGTVCRADETDAPTLAPTNAPTSATPRPTPGLSLPPGISLPPSLSHEPTIIARLTVMPVPRSNATLSPTIIPQNGTNSTERVQPIEIDIEGDGSLVIEQIIDYDTQTVSVVMTYLGESWLGFAFTESPSMISNDTTTPNVAIIGLPEEGTVQKYLLGGKTIDLVTLLSSDRQTLTNTSIVQEDGATILSFTKPLADVDEVPVTIEGENRFLYAVGSSPDLDYHGAIRGFAAAKIPVIRATTAAPAATSRPTSTAPLTRLPTKKPPSNTPTRSPTTSVLLSKNPSHRPTTSLIEATLSPAGVVDRTEMPALRPTMVVRPPTTRQPAISPNTRPTVPNVPKVQPISIIPPNVLPPTLPIPAIQSVPPTTCTGPPTICTGPPASQPDRPMSMPPPARTPLKPVPTNDPIDRHGDDDDYSYRPSVDYPDNDGDGDNNYHSDDESDDDPCDCSSSESKQKGKKGKSYSSNGKSNPGKGKKEKGKEKGKSKDKSKGKKSEKCKCHYKGEKRHSEGYGSNFQANHALHHDAAERGW